MMQAFDKHQVNPKKGGGNSGLHTKRIQKAIADSVMADLFKPKKKKGAKKK